MHDMRQALRFMRAKPAWTAVAVASMALGIAANTVVFSVVDAVLLRPLPYLDAERIVFMWRGQSEKGGPGLAGADIIDWRDQAESLSGVAPFIQGADVPFGTDGSDLVGLSHVGHDAFDVLGVSPAQGRPLRPEDDRVGSPLVVVVSHGFWLSRLGGDPDAIGRAVRVGGQVREVVGVMPPGFFFPDHAVQLWANLSDFGGDRLAERGDVFFRAVARLAPGTPLARARAEIATIDARLDAEYGGTRNTGMFPARDVLIGDYRLALWTLLGAVGALLLIACANVANLLLGRGLDRQPELAVRASLGASRLALARQLLVESLLLAGSAALVSLVLAFWGIRAVQALGLVDIPRIEEATLDLRVLVFTLGVSLIAGLLFGLLPAFRGSRVDLTASLKAGGQTAAETHRGSLRDLLLVAEVALALVLMVTAGLLVRSFASLRAFDWGFEPEGLVGISVGAPDSLRRADFLVKVDFADRALEGLAGIPGVRSASVGLIAPLVSYFYSGARLAIDGRIVDQASNYEITHGYFATLGTRILDGREFLPDRGAGLPEVVLGAALAARLFPDGAVGRTLELVVVRPDVLARVDDLPSREEAMRALDDPANLDFRPYTVVGVVQDVHMFDWDLGGSAVYTDLRRDTLMRGRFDVGFVPRQFVLRADGDLESVVNAARASLSRTEPGLTFDKVVSLEEAASRAIGAAGTNNLLVAVSTTFGTLALLLASVGIYGVMSHLVSRRTYEIGVRMALGADRASVIMLVLRQSLRLTVLGLALGVTGAWAATRLLESLLFNVSPTDLLTFAALTGFLLLTAVFAALIPARRASRVDPLVATRAM
jgi:predicted permease